MIEYYTNLDDLINMLVQIKSDGHGYLSFPKAIYLLANEIKDIKTKLELNDDQKN